MGELRQNYLPDTFGSSYKFDARLLAMIAYHELNGGVTMSNCYIHEAIKQYGLQILGTGTTIDNFPQRLWLWGRGLWKTTPAPLIPMSKPATRFEKKRRMVMQGIMPDEGDHEPPVPETLPRWRQTFIRYVKNLFLDDQGVFCRDRLEDTEIHSLLSSIWTSPGFRHKSGDSKYRKSIIHFTDLLNVAMEVDHEQWDWAWIRMLLKPYETWKADVYSLGFLTVEDPMEIDMIRGFNLFIKQWMEDKTDDIPQYEHYKV
jgi:hypothetical protein